MLQPITSTRLQHPYAKGRDQHSLGCSTKVPPFPAHRESAHRLIHYNTFPKSWKKAQEASICLRRFLGHLVGIRSFENSSILCCNFQCCICSSWAIGGSICKGSHVWWWHLWPSWIPLPRGNDWQTRGFLSQGAERNHGKCARKICSKSWKGYSISGYRRQLGKCRKVLPNPFRAIWVYSSASFGSILCDRWTYHFCHSWHDGRGSVKTEHE